MTQPPNQQPHENQGQHPHYPQGRPVYEAPPANAPHQWPAPQQYAAPEQWPAPQQPAAPEQWPGQHQAPVPAPQQWPAQHQMPAGAYPAPAYQAPVQLPPPGPGGIFDGAQHPSDLSRPLYGATLGQAFVRFFKNYANFQGRASRSELWWMVLVNAVTFILVAIFAGVISSMTYDRFGPMGGLGQGLGVLLGIVLLALVFGTMIPWLAITWRRLHDADMPGPLYFLSFIPYAGSLAVFVLMLMPPKPAGRRFDNPATY